MRLDRGWMYLQRRCDRAHCFASTRALSVGGDVVGLKIVRQILLFKRLKRVANRLAGGAPAQAPSIQCSIKLNSLIRIESGVYVPTSLVGLEAREIVLRFEDVVGALQIGPAADRQIRAPLREGRVAGGRRVPRRRQDVAENKPRIMQVFLYQGRAGDARDKLRAIVVSVHPLDESAVTAAVCGVSEDGNTLLAVTYTARIPTSSALASYCRHTYQNRATLA
jgi:hypothetical protein